MGTLNEDLTAIKTVEDTIIANKVARFAYTEEAYEKNYANGVIKYNVNNAQNIPTADPSVLKVNDTVLSQGYRAQASSITRMLMNHFLGRLSYNVNKVNDGFSNLVATLIKHRGTANGFATLDENGRIPYSQLPESSVGDVKTVNNISPENGNIPLTGENIPVSSTDPTLLSAPLTTDRYADRSVTEEKLADNAVTNAKIKDPISVAKGGTGATDAKKGFMNLANGLIPSQNPRDTEYMIYKTLGNWGLYTFLQFWDYIKSKISSVLGLTATQYNGNAKTATNAVSANTATQATNATNATNAYNAYRGMVHTCSTSASTVAKTVSVTGFTLVTGACIRVVFTNGNSVAKPTLNVNGTGAKEIVVLNTGSVKTLTSPHGSPNTGAYKWDNNTILELYYNGSYWVAINNPIIAQKTTCTDGTTADKPAYSCRLDGYKEIYGSIFLGDVTINSGSKQTFSLPMTMGSSAYNASIALRQNNLALLGGDAELSYYGNTTSLTINMWNGNRSDPINDAVLTWIVKGY